MLKLKKMLRKAYDKGKKKGIEIGRDQVLTENIHRLKKEIESNEIFKSNQTGTE